MKTIGIVIMLITALLTVGCADTERISPELTNAKARIHTLDSTLAEVYATSMMESAQVYNLTQDIGVMQDEADALETALVSTKARLGRLDTEHRRARVEFHRTLDSLRGVNTALAINLNTFRSELENSRITIVASERRTNDLIRARDSVYAFVDDLRPWYDYYKQESERNWFKKLLKAGDAIQPLGVEPSFESNLTPTPLEAVRP